MASQWLIYGEHLAGDRRCSYDLPAPTVAILPARPEASEWGMHTKLRSRSQSTCGPDAYLCLDYGSGDLPHIGVAHRNLLTFSFAANQVCSQRPRYKVGELRSMGDRQGSGRIGPPNSTLVVVLQILTSRPSTMSLAREGDKCRLT